jgi:hypothetical protein
MADYMDASKCLSGRVLDADPRPMSVDVDALIGCRGAAVLKKV